MNRVVAISSIVAHGHVGLSAIVPTLHKCGIDCTAFPTVLLSNHPGFEIAAGEVVAPSTLKKMLSAVEQNGWLRNVGVVLTGYLPTPEHVQFARFAIDRVKMANPDARIICDPILGDDPKGLYINQTAAKAMRDDVLPAANVALPNRFELAWLSGTDVDNATSAIAAARRLPVERTIAKSISKDEETLLNLEIIGDAVTHIATKRQFGVPHGTGDVLSALIAAGIELRTATRSLDRLIAMSHNKGHLQIVGAKQEWLIEAVKGEPANITPIA